MEEENRFGKEGGKGKGGKAEDQQWSEVLERDFEKGETTKEEGKDQINQKLGTR